LGPVRRTFQEIGMRTLLVVIAVIFVAGCASTARSDLAKVYDRKSNTTTYAAKPSESEFVGMSASARGSTKAQPGWYRYGHP
jgi:uncharacterized protein YceK